MKKNLLIIMALACAFAFALVGCSSGASSAASSDASDSASAESSAAAAEESSEAASSSEESGQTGLANPWSDVDSAAAAAEGAGIDGFDVPEGVTISLGDVTFSSYRCMDGLAEAISEFPAVEMTIRKGLSSVAENGDISGDYNQYANTWTQNIKGLEVTCFGNREGDATKTIWSVDDTCYSIFVQGLGGDEDYGLSADDLNSLINALQ